MATQDEEFIAKLRATFQVEAQEHLQTISSMLLELEKSASSTPRTQTLENIYRDAHSLKGAARAVGMLDIEAVCQAMEGVFFGWKSHRTVPSPKAFDTLYHAVDAIRSFLTSPDQDPGEQRRRNDLVQRLDRLQGVTPPMQTKDPVKIDPPPPAPLPAPAPPDPQTTPQPTSQEKAVIDQTVRISIAKLDSRLLQAEDMLTVKTLTAQRALDLHEMTAEFEQWKKQWAAVSAEAHLLRQAAEQAGAAEAVGAPVAVSPAMIRFLDWNRDYARSLQDKLLSLAEQASNDRHSIDRRVEDLLEDSKKMLMLPFQTLADTLPRLVRDLSRDQEKEINLVIRGGEIEVDKRILEEMKDVLIHLLRNCIDHGVEKPAERARLNKPRSAVVTLAVSQVSGDKVEILVSDDGAGVDLESLKRSAVRLGAITEADARGLDEAQALALIFQSGISTSPIITSISGRGLGMAIVRARIEKLGGQIEVQSKRSLGTSFRMVLPLTMATFRGVLIRTADTIYVVPTSSVERVLRIRPRDIRTVENRQTLSLQGRVISLARLDIVMGLPQRPFRGDDSAPMPVIVLRWADQEIGFVVDDVMYEEEVLVKPLPKPLLRVRNVAGVTILGSGKAVVVLSISDLVKSARSNDVLSTPVADQEVKPQSTQKRVLVVEDSITSRMLIKGILEGAGYKVKIAVDGVDAVTALREGEFDLVVSDVEMPRMNGFDLTAKIRAEKRLADLPVVLVTALESRDERERGIDAGANAYIVKSSFDQMNLLEVVQRLV